MFVHFTKKVVLITGASSGIGEALAREFHRLGAEVVLTARRLDRLKLIAEELSRNGIPALYFACDVTRDGELAKVVALIHERFGRLDVVVANAGFGVVGNVLDLTMDDYRRQFETNIFGVLRTVQETARALMQTSGRLAVVGSVNGYVALPGNSPYAMSKFAVRALTTSLYYELGRAGVSVTHIAPGFVESEIRKVDNRGVLHARAKDRVPDWLQMPADKAARKIASAIYFRRRERVVTAHGRFAVLLERFCPWFIAFAIRLAGATARPEPHKT